MMEISYELYPGEVNQDIIEVCNHHWVDESGKLWWGLPGGTFSDFIDRLLSYDQDWKGDTWTPVDVKETTESRARDLLLASLLFPFRMLSSVASAEYVVLPLVEYFVKGEYTILSGSGAVASMLLSVENPDGMTEVLREIPLRNEKLKVNDWVNLSEWMSLLETAGSVVQYEAYRSMIKTSKTNRVTAERGALYTALADVANANSAAVRLSERRGSIGKRISTYMSKVRTFKAEVDSAPRRRPVMKRIATENLISVLREPIRHMTGKAPKDCMVYRTRRCERIRIAACPGVTIMHILGTKMVYFLTEEDLKSMKFVAMSHSMWHMYAATLDMEYYKDPVLTADDPLDVELKQIAGQLEGFITLLANKIVKTGKRFDLLKQQIVGLEDLRISISRLWDVYMDILRHSVYMRMQDYLGRYLHELFEAYTSILGGHLAVEGRASQVAELIATYTPLGFKVTDDMRRFEHILSDMPISAVQDFGRFSKIVFAYDVNPIYSYIHRVNAMRKPNPIGEATFDQGSSYSYTTRPATAAENKEREDKYKCALHVLLAIADIRRTTLPLVKTDMLDDATAMVWSDMVAFFRENKIAMRVNTKALRRAMYDVPAVWRDRARSQADLLVTKGEMPTTPWAGAYLDIENLFLYEQRGDPDLHILKATSVPDKDPLVVLSNTGFIPRVTPCRNSDGRRDPLRGDMIMDYLAGKAPTRASAIDHIRSHDALCTTSDKIETNKYPLKTRVTTGLCAEARRVQSEFEYNNGRVLTNVPGFTVGVDPADIKRRIYSSIRADLAPDMTRIFGSLDLSSWSTGMHWDIQEWTNQVLRFAYDGGDDNFAVLDKCTKGSLMMRAQSDIRLVSRNTIGANYEGVDGKRNTLMHCALWYLARCDAYEEGVEGTMRAFLYIDDGAMVLECKKDEAIEITKTLRKSILKTYVRYGFKFSVLKTVFSEVYMQFLNEIYFHGIHVGYGFRALCHTAAQTFPPLATVSEELAVISSGIRGAAVSGGHVLRLMAGYHAILSLYMEGVIGNKGRCFAEISGIVQALALLIPTNAGGFGTPTLTQLTSNLAGNRDVEKLDRCRKLMTMARVRLSSASHLLKGYMAGYLGMTAEIPADRVPDRVTTAHPASSLIGPGRRTLAVAEAALSVARHQPARVLLTDYLRSGVNPSKNSVAAAFASYAAVLNQKLPMTMVDRALATDPYAAIVTLVDKIAKSDKVSNLLTNRQVKSMNRKYYGDARNRITGLAEYVR